MWLESLSHKPRVICLTETWLHDTSLPVVILGYKMYNFPRTTGIGGGFLVKSNIVCLVLTLTHDAFASFEYAALSFTINGRAIMLFGIYRPPPTSIIDFVVELSFLLINPNNTTVKDNLIIAGDFNIDLLSNKCQYFTNLLLSYAAYPTIFYPIHITENSKSLIDNFFNCNYLWQSGVLDCNLSDHEIIFFSIYIHVAETRLYDHISKFFSCKLFCKYIHLYSLIFLLTYLE